MPRAAVGAKPRSRALPPHLLEAPLQRAAETTLRLYGWRFYHRPDRVAGRGEQAGLPDLVAVHPCGRLLFIECKSVSGKLSDPQRGWLLALAQSAAWTDGVVEVLVVRPGDEPQIIRAALCTCRRGVEREA